MKLDQSCLLLEKRRCWGYGVCLCIAVLIVMILNACSTSRATKENEASKQPDAPQSQERLKKPAQLGGVSAQDEIGEKAGKRPVAENDSESPAAKQKSIENSETAIDAGQREGAAQTDDEKLSDMENKMDESLTEFDEMLLEKNREISRKKQQMTKDGEEDSTASESEDDDLGGQEREGGQDEKRISGSEDRSQQNETATAPSSVPGKGQGAAIGQPKGIPDGSDDDVVARQLREAAEKETDPQLKKKLWEEYRRYKEG